ncbi:iron(III) transport system permease protein [Caldimonas thermodepolymerans]|jgi:ABC-type Fe3+ transport system, permease component|uniref:Iron(III) transport system permease protein n=2 Tax=Caldimonas thermodepolymerans TaxID=215580 RepID=A0AA46HVA7_9BURK|nr:iron(III) transport system permease protein [Caldimonas thermodepolymerans]TCP06372.1 iron(III) transport system permease protein [Caldimonas thermodepolymerans]
MVVKAAADALHLPALLLRRIAVLMRLLSVLTLLLALPVLGVVGSWAVFNADSFAVIAHQFTTVLPGYAWTSFLLSACVALGVAVVGGLTAATVTLFDFPGRRVFEWALLLPLAMPAYVMAYAYTDFLQYSGPLQTALRALTGREGAMLPDVRSLGGAVPMFIFSFYPYVYLLTRAALSERGVHLMEAARLLGAGTARRVWRVALPLARPAMAAGVALALMETLADYGVGSYFGLNTFTTGIYKAWLSMDDRIAAAQLATVLLAVVALLLWFEHRAQRRLRFATGRGGHGGGQEARPVPLAGRHRWLAWTVCTVPVLLGFVLPVLVLLRLLWAEMHYSEFGMPWDRFAQWSWASFRLAAIAAALAVLLSVALAFAMRTSPRPGLRFAVRVVSLGYAVPGAVIAVGILLPLGWLQSVWPDSGLTALVTGTAFGLLYAYLVRFSAVALQSVESGYARIPVTLDESARMLGTPRWKLLGTVHVPLLRRSALAAGLLVFVDVMKELPATYVLRPFNSDTLAVVANQLARDERLGEAALPSLAIVLVGLLPVVLLSRAMRAQRG